VGGFYANVVVRSDDVNGIIQAIRMNGGSAAVAADGRHVVVADEKLDAQDEEWLGRLSAQLCAATGRPALGVLIHDDSLVLMALAQPGVTVHRYNSCPAYFTGEGSECPVGGDAAVFAEAFGVPSNADALGPVLNACMAETPEDDDFEYTFESDRHKAIAELLEVPAWSVWFSYAGLKESPPDDFDPSLVRHYGAF
jgi:hypothetical protein